MTGEGGGPPAGHAPRSPLTLRLGPEADTEVGRRLGETGAVQDTAETGLNITTLHKSRVTLVIHLCCDAVT